MTRQRENPRLTVSALEEARDGIIARTEGNPREADEIDPARIRLTDAVIDHYLDRAATTIREVQDQLRDVVTVKGRSAPR